MIDQNFWRGKRVFVTGHTGFKGSWLCLLLERMGAEVTGLSLGRVSNPSLYDVAGVESTLRSVEGDVRDAAFVRGAVEQSSPDVVLHLAAQSLVRRSYDDPLETFSTNVLGTANVLDAVRSVDTVRSVVMITSDKCYENNEWEWPYREDDALGGADPYSASKAGAELVIDSFRRSYFGDVAAVNVASARAGNVIGGGDWSVARLVPDVMRAALEGKTVTIRNPGSLRPWQHVLNPLSGYLLLAQNLWNDGSYATSFNFGPGENDTPPASDVVTRLCQLWGGGMRWEHDDGDHPHEAGLLRLDSSRAHSLLGWSPVWDLDEGLNRIVDWYRAFGRGDEMRNATVVQIDAFLAASSS